VATPLAVRRIATTCNNCYGVDGVSADAAIPNLAGQSGAALYKQLEDFRSGKRGAAVMGVFVDQLSQDEVLDLATYFGSLRNPFAATTEAPRSSLAGARHLIVAGDPMRGIAPCAACRGPVGLAPGAPGLRGQQRAYLEQQMRAFAPLRKIGGFSNLGRFCNFSRPGWRAHVGCRRSNRGLTLRRRHASWDLSPIGDKPRTI
jgi:cytochrome c553